MNAGELKKAKRDVRRIVLAARDALGEAERTPRSAAIHERFLALPEVERAGTVMLFWSFGSEVSTPPLIERLHARATRVALPRIRGPRDLEVVGFAPADPVRETSFGAREPTGGPVLDPSSIDLVVTPGVAFDRTGGRIGYGGGFYDRFLLVTRPGVPRVSLAFDLQVLDVPLPAGAFDLRVDLIVTETRTVRCPPRTAST
jgi:5-formyltetrahydrofolate cyclo-ligase